MIKTIWKPVKNHPGYKVSNMGDIRCFRHKKLTDGYLLKPTKNNKGYLIVNIDDRCTTVHRIVAKAFIPNPNKHRQVNHLDGNKLNNTVSNLEWCSPSYNMLHAFHNHIIQPRPRIQKLTESQVLDIRKELRQGTSHALLAQKYGVTQTHISNINTNRVWAAVQL